MSDNMLILYILHVYQVNVLDVTSRKKEVVDLESQLLTYTIYFIISDTSCIYIHEWFLGWKVEPYNELACIKNEPSYICSHVW